MRGYWLRILGAWFLLLCAQRLMKQAERLVGTTMTAEVEGAVIEVEISEAVETPDPTVPESNGANSVFTPTASMRRDAVPPNPLYGDDDE